jgi:hypothetical protein
MHPYLHTVVSEVCVLTFILPLFILISSLAILSLCVPSVLERRGCGSTSGGSYGGCTSTLRSGGGWWRRGYRSTLGGGGCGPGRSRAAMGGGAEAAVAAGRPHAAAATGWVDLRRWRRRGCGGCGSTSGDGDCGLGRPQSAVGGDVETTVVAGRPRAWRLWPASTSSSRRQCRGYDGCGSTSRGGDVCGSASSGGSGCRSTPSSAVLVP